MAARKSRFLLNAANLYSEKCPELSRIIMMKYLTHLNHSLESNFPDELRGKLCEHCGTVFTSDNCNFRIKPKRKRGKKKKTKPGTQSETKQKDFGRCSRVGLPRRSNFLQILCSYCGWKTRHVGIARYSRVSRKFVDGDTKTSETSGTPLGSSTSTPKSFAMRNLSGSSSFSQTPNSLKGSRQKKPKTRLKALLAKEKEEANDRASTPPSLMNFLASL